MPNIGHERSSGAKKVGISSGGAPVRLVHGSNSNGNSVHDARQGVPVRYSAKDSSGAQSQSQKKDARIASQALQNHQHVTGNGQVQSASGQKAARSQS